MATRSNLPPVERLLLERFDVGVESMCINY